MKTHFLAITALVTCIFAASASAVVVTTDFEALVGTPFYALDSHGYTVTTEGFEFSTDARFGGFASWNSGANYTGSTALFANQTNANLSLQEVGGGLFSILSLDIAFSDLAQQGTSSLFFTGEYADSNTVTQKVHVDALLTTVNLKAGFSGIVALD